MEYYMPKYRYRLFVDGGYQSECNVYDWMFQRGLALAMYKKLDFMNTGSPDITDKWRGENGMVVITRIPINYPNKDKNLYCKF